MTRLLKILKNGAAVAIMGTFMFVSCKQKTTQTPFAREIIPADASLVISVNYDNIVRKGNLTDLENYAFLKGLRNELETAPSNIRETAMSFIKDPSSLGLDLKNIYIFGVQNGDEMAVFVSADIAQLSVFEDVLKKIEAGEQVDRVAFKIIEDGQFAISWNREVALLSFTNGYDYAALYEKKTSICTDAEFTGSYPAEGDIRIWCRYENLLKFATSINPEMSLPSVVEDYKNLYVAAYIDFVDGKIVADITSGPKSEVDRIAEKYPVARDKFNDKLLGDLPEPSFLLFKYAVNTRAFVDLLTQTSGEIEEASPLNSPELQKVIDALAGDFAIDIHGFAQGFMPLPLVSAVFSVNGEEGFNDILSLVPEQFASKTGGYYTAVVPPMFSIFYAYKDGRVIVTNDDQQIASFTGKSSDRTLKDNETIKKYAASPTLVYLNLDLSSYPANIQSLVKNASFGEQSDALKTILSRLNSFVVWQSDKYTSTGNLKFADSSVNSLQSLLQIFDICYEE
jgi:hypothetical protein